MNINTNGGQKKAKKQVNESEGEDKEKAMKEFLETSILEAKNSNVMSKSRLWS